MSFVDVYKSRMFLLCSPRWRHCSQFGSCGKGYSHFRPTYGLNLDTLIDKTFIHILNWYLNPTKGLKIDIMLNTLGVLLLAAILKK